MAKAVSIRKDIPVEEVYACARKEKGSRARARMLGIAAVLEGKSRSHATRIAGLDINNFRAWLRRFNEMGLEGLRGKKYVGKQVDWPDGAEQFLKEKALEGASFDTDQRVTYRLKDFQALIEEKFGVRYCLATLWNALKRLGLSWISVRQKHPKSNPAAQEEFKKKCLSSSMSCKSSIQPKY